MTTGFVKRENISPDFSQAGEIPSQQSTDRVGIPFDASHPLLHYLSAFTVEIAANDVATMPKAKPFLPLVQGPVTRNLLLAPSNCLVYLGEKFGE